MKPIKCVAYGCSLPDGHAGAHGAKRDEIKTTQIAPIGLTHGPLCRCAGCAPTNEARERRTRLEIAVAGRAEILAASKLARAAIANVGAATPSGTIDHPVLVALRTAIADLDRAMALANELCDRLPL